MARYHSAVPDANDSGATRLAVAALASVLLTFLTGIWLSRNIVFGGTAANATVISAVLILVGTLVTVVASVLGMLLKHSLDKRTEARLIADSERNQSLQRSSDDRLKLEASIQVIQLFALPSGAPSLPIQRMGALITLSGLGQHALALTLMAALLQEGSIDPATAAHVFERALRDGDAGIRSNATSLLDTFAHRLISESGYELPRALLDQKSDLPLHTRQWAAVIVAKLICSRSKLEWLSKYRSSLWGLLGRFAFFWQAENDPHTKEDIGAVLFALLAAAEAGGVIVVPAGLVDVATIRLQTETLRSDTDQIVEAVEALHAWSAGNGAA